MALCCISPVLAAKVLGGVKVTMGRKGDKWPYGDAIDAAKSVASLTTGGVSKQSTDSHK